MQVELSKALAKDITPEEAAKNMQDKIVAAMAE